MRKRPWTSYLTDNERRLVLRAQAAKEDFQEARVLWRKMSGPLKVVRNRASQRAWAARQS